MQEDVDDLEYLMTINNSLNTIEYLDDESTNSSDEDKVNEKKRCSRSL